jgi:membrane-associated phospholipid phosphatase
MFDSSWILSVRTDFLTDIFKLFPFFASVYFYIAIIALGYWLNPSKLLFRSLAFLVPFSALLNCLLKNLFRIPRPDISLHLVPVFDPFGFPSGDVQVATVFWGTIFISSKNSELKYLFLLPIVGIAISRVYLGVHSIYDVIGGLFFGFCVLYTWKKYIEEKLITKGFPSSYKKFWVLFLIIVLLYMVLSIGVKWPSMVPMSIGALIGFGLSLNWIDANILRHKMSVLMALISLIAIIVMAKFFPVIRSNQLLFFCSLIVEYAVIIFGVLILIPSIVFKVSKLRLYLR